MKLKILLLLHALFLQTFFIYRRKSILDKDNFKKLKRRNCPQASIFTSILENFLIYNSKCLSKVTLEVSYFNVHIFNIYRKNPYQSYKFRHHSMCICLQMYLHRNPRLSQSKNSAINGLSKMSFFTCN